MTALRRSARSKSTDKKEEPEVDKRPELSASDAERIARVLEALAPDTLEQKMPFHSSPTLRALLSQPRPKLRDVWNAMKQASEQAARHDARGHVGILVAMHVLVRMAHEGGHDVDDTAPTAYALHMHLPSGEYFTNAVHLRESYAHSLDTGVADLVSVAPLVRGDVPTPSLGERVRQLKKSTQAPAPKSTTSAFLSYGAFGSSLGPSFDSTGSTVDAETSASTWGEQQRVSRNLRRRWGHFLAQSVDAAYTTARNAMEEDGPESWSDADLIQAAIDVDPALDPSLMKQAVDVLTTDDILTQNEIRLDELQEMQWLRVRMMKDDSVPIPPAMIEREQLLAEQVLSSLVDLLCQATPSALGRIARAAGPLMHMSHAALVSSISDTRTGVAPRGFWGTLPDAFYGAASKTTLSLPGMPPDSSSWATLLRPAAIADNVTAHAAPERRNVLASEYEQFAASPATAVKNVLIQPRAPAIYASSAPRPPYAAGGSPYPRP